MKKRLSYKKDFFFIRKRVVPSSCFDPAECATYYSSDLGAYVKQRMNEEIDSVLHSPFLRKELKKFLLSLSSRRVVLLGFGYAVPFMETFLRNFYDLMESFNRKNQASSITFSAISLIPPQTNSPERNDGAFQVRKIAPLPPKTQLESVQEEIWPFKALRIFL